MNHPTREDWMSYLYEELSAAEHVRMAEHLQGCPECAAAVKDWQATQKSLEWPLPLRDGARRKPAPAIQLLKWAAAVVILCGVGFGAGRFAATGADARKLSAALEPRLQEQVQAARADLRREFTQMLR